MSQSQLPSRTLQVLIPQSESLEPESFWAQAPDDELVAVYVRSRSQAAMETLVRRHGPMVANLLGRMLSKNDDREEAFQATFIVLMQSAKRIRKQASVSSFLYGVAFRIAKRVRQRRSEQFRKLVADGHAMVPNQVSDEDQSPFEQLSHRLQLESMDEELQRLPVSMRSPIVEHYYSGLSVPQIAESMQLSVSAVEGRIKRGKQLLRNRLAVRGVSLSATIAAITQLPSPVSASQVDAWCHQVTAHGTDSETSTIDSSLSSPSLQQLIQGELSMQLTHRTSWVIWSCALCALSAIGLGIFPWADTGNSDFSRIAISNVGGTEQQDEANLQITSSPAQQPADNQGNVKAGQSTGTGATKMEKVPDVAKEKEPVLPTVVWTRPSETPEWLQAGRTDSPNVLQIRQKLEQEVKIDFAETPLSGVMEQFSRTLKIDILLDTRALEEENVPSDHPVTLKLSPLTLRNALHHILAPLNLQYFIDHDVLVIASDAATIGLLRTYDLSLILPDNSTVSQLIHVVENTISPDGWQNVGGNSTLDVYGSLLVVRAPEETHEKIEELLRILSKQSPEHIRPAAMPKNLPMGGMGGGGMM